VSHYSIIKKLVFFGLLFALLSVKTWGLNGNEIVANATQYLTWIWTCNPENARIENRIIRWDRTLPNGGRNALYPFYPQGVEIGPDPDGNGPLAAPTATGQHTGVPYAWGLRETTEMFGGSDGRSGKLTWAYAGKRMLAGNHNNTYKNDSVNKYKLWAEYTGIDCSGLVWNATGMPALPRASNPYSLCRFNTTHIMNDNGLFSDAIGWDVLKKGDILIINAKPMPDTGFAFEIQVIQNFENGGKDEKDIRGNFRFDVVRGGVRAGK